MNKVNRGNIPRILNNSSKKLLEISKIENMFKNNEEIKDGDFKIYREEEVKKQLREDFCGKCCYCGSEISHDTSYPNIEHYRPKTAVTSEKGKKSKPGYFWLASDWENLLYSCERCNRAKGTKFPLKDESQRKIHAQDISFEEPLLIDITKDDYSFEKNYLYNNDSSNKDDWIFILTPINDCAETTISLCNLWRTELEEKKNKLVEELVINCYGYLDNLEIIEETDVNTSTCKIFCKSLYEIETFIEEYFGIGCEKQPHLNFKREILKKYSGITQSNVNNHKLSISMSKAKLRDYDNLKSYIDYIQLRRKKRN